MDLKMCNSLKYKVTYLEPAIMADAATNIIMTEFGIPWEMEYPSDEEYTLFCSHFKESFLLNIDRQVDTLDEVLVISPTLWLRDEYTFSKLLYNLRLEYVKESSKTFFRMIDSCLKILYYANIFYKGGLNKAPDMAFIEVYGILCDYFKAIGYW